MSQHDLDIANQGFPATRADINNALQALGSSNSGATAPSTTYANQLWYDTANNIIKIRNEDNDAWISLFTLDQTADNIEALTINGTLTADALTVDTDTLHVDATNNNVGIGTTSPQELLHLNDSSSPAMRLTNSTTGTGSGDGSEIMIGDADNTLRIINHEAGHIRFDANGSERMRINSGGFVAISSASTPSESCELYVDDTVLIGGTNAVSGAFPTSGLGIITTTGSYIATFYDDNNLSTPRFRFDRNGNLNVSGSVSKGSGSFRIDHPLASKNATHDLVHSFIEGPKADLIYRGKVDLVAGSATVNIDTAAGMTDGTFALLCDDVQCFTSNEDGFTAIKGAVSGNTLTITAEDNTCADTVSWMVIGERKDQHMLDTDWTNDNGKIVVEPLKGWPAPPSDD